ncbi:MAG: ABC transporter permease [Chloroflexia bacterium]|nr:ABC transporter permease [Chloroflexia bacterium]
MGALGMMVWTELKLLLREPAAVFFTLAFPLLILFIFGGIFGNEPSPRLGGRGSVDVSVPGYAAQVIGTATLIGLPITLAAYRQAGVLRRLRATPVPPIVVLGAHVAVTLLATLVGVGLLVIAARLVYGLAWPAAPGGVALALILATLSLSAVGFAIGGALPTARTAQAVGSAIFFPQLFLSGAAIPRELMTGPIREIADALPLTQVVILVGDLWTEGTWSGGALVAIVVMLGVSLAVAGRTFRWD